ncbi:response regulator [Paenibacillus alba]|uniref:helix-turn-helix domain-containing protein n=1 Tax=Paenibacillus alba TaxID=1197127 RepID=UPI001567AB39|nr:helix-turn-helix domain-containing protein [Paenibacillus alba]NQX71321.1 response regulator [Paenibacillus alba]
MLLNLLIVEDELTTREGLYTMIDWRSLGIRVCGQASNGLDAMDIINSGGVDLLLSDIRMPIMDGLQLLTEINNKQMDIPSVLLTGYSDFEYAQRALRLGALDYIIKPCPPREIASVFEQVVMKTLDKRKHQHDWNGLQYQLKENIPIVKSQTLLEWLHHPKRKNENRSEQLRKLEISISAEHTLVIIIHPDGKPLNELNYSRTDLQLIQFATTNIVQETLEQSIRQPVEVIKDQDGIIAICSGTLNLLRDKIMTGLSQLQRNLEKYLKITVSIGISSSKASIDSLAEAYIEANSALELRFYRGLGGIYFYTESETLLLGPLPAQTETERLRLEPMIIDHLRSGLYAEALNLTEQWLDYFHAEHAHSRMEINLQTISLIARLMQLGKEQELAAPGWSDSLVAMADQVHRVETFEELSGLVYKSIQQLVELRNPHKTPRRKVQQAVELIAEHYNSTALSLAGVAKELFVSSTYLSTLFKQELGINFLDYIHQYRIERAKALLQSGAHKIQTIAREVGYFDEAHFTRTFKKWTGLSPSQYKKEALEPKL